MVLKKIILSIFLAAALVGCDNSEERYSREYPCVFTFNTTLHSTSALTRCIDNPTMFVRVDVKRENGIHVLYVYPNSGENERIMLSTDDENYRIGQVGANNSIIVGCSTFNGLKAYDAQCPNCLDQFSSSNFPLTFVGNGQAVTCKKCSRTYQLNSEGITDKGLRLLEYHVRYDGQRLKVTNH